MTCPDRNPNLHRECYPEGPSVRARSLQRANRPEGSAPLLFRSESIASSEQVVRAVWRTLRPAEQIPPPYVRPPPHHAQKQEQRVLGTPVLMTARARLTGCRNDTLRNGHILWVVQRVLRRLPPSRLRGAEQRFHHCHVLDGVFQRDWNLAFSADRFRECVTLDGVLVAEGKRLGGHAAAVDVAAVVDEDAAGAGVWRVEREFHID